uniref:ATP synthase F0 subunit 8 n=1 Tax=Molanna truncata TaxID=2942250 RepID=A0A9E8LQB2_9NEOP|nr:ATP synthase F0 subunit 8 [Molanna truncata]UZZ44159.1 ATP synthase F0 subunit 8 [Molanna truncata]
MPQMLPMNWILLYILFSMTLMIFIMMNFYYYKMILNYKHMNQLPKFKSNNWMW